MAQFDPRSYMFPLPSSHDHAYFSKDDIEVSPPLLMLTIPELTDLRELC